MATRNYYPVNAVAAILLHSIRAGDRETAKAAAGELVASEETELLMKLLTLAWLLAPTETDCEKSRCAAYLSKDYGAFLTALLAKPFLIPELPTPTAIPPPSYEIAAIPVAPVPSGWTAGHAAVLWRAIESAHRAGNSRRVFRLLSPLLESDITTVVAILRAIAVPEQLIELLEDTVFVPLTYRVLIHAAAAAVGSLPPKRAFPIPKPGRGARTFSVSGEALGLWGVRATPVDQVIGKPLFVCQNPTHFWSALLKKHGADSSLNFPTDDACEAFYSEGFPDDIPDEWSAEERAKSHGIAPVGEKSPWTPAFLLCFT